MIFHAFAYIPVKTSAENVSTHEPGAYRVSGGLGLQGSARPVIAGMRNTNTLILKHKVQIQVDRARANISKRAGSMKEAFQSVMMGK